MSRICSVAAAYFLGAVFGGWLSAPNAFATFWPPNGILLAALLASPRRYWPVLVLATCPANVAFNLIEGQPSAINLAFWSVNAVEALIAAAVLTRGSLRVHALPRIRDVLAFGGVALTVTGTAAILGAIIARAGDTSLPLLDAWLSWWAADLLGLILVTPVALPWFRSADERATHEIGSEGVAFAVVCIVIGAGVTIGILGGERPLMPPLLLVVPLAGWAALRLGVCATGWALLVTASLSLLAHAHGAGTLLEGRSYTPDVAYALQAMISGVAITFLAIAAAIEEQARAETALRRRQDDRDLLLRAITHEIRNPVASILGGVEIVREDRREPPIDHPAVLTMIERSARHILAMVDQAIDLGRTGSGLPVTLERWWLPPLWRDLQRTCKDLAHSRDTLLHWDARVPNVTLSTDRARLEIIVRNLVANALKFTDRGQVTVSCQLVGDDLRLRVQDTGIGIPPELQERVFQLYERGTHAATQHRTGTGIGLYVVRRFADDIGGTVALQSEVGVGTVITVDLPTRTDAARTA